MSTERLSRGHWVAWLAALALLLVMSLDWWGTTLGDDFRRTESLAPSGGVQSGEIGRKVTELAGSAAERQEHNAWQPRKALDTAILIVLLLAVAGTFAALWARAAGRQGAAGVHALAGMAAALGALLVAYRIAQEPGIDSITTVKIGAPLAVLCCAALALAHSSALRAGEATDPGPQAADEAATAEAAQAPS